MIKIGPIRNIFRGWRILICAWADDNCSYMKSQFFALFRAKNGKEYIKIGKYLSPDDRPFPRLVIPKWSIYSYFGKRGDEKSFVWFGLGKFMEGEDL